MRALCWHGTGDVRVGTVPDARIEHPHDIVVKITASGICGSDLHLLNGFIPTMKSGDILGYEPMGIVIEAGTQVPNLRVGHSPSGLFGFSHIMGGFPGGQAEYLRVPFADVGPLKIESNLSEEKVLFLSDIFPTGYMAAENCGIPFGAFMNKGLTLKSGQTHMQRYMKPFLSKIESREFDPSFVITHRVSLEEAPDAYRTFRDKMFREITMQ